MLLKLPIFILLCTRTYQSTLIEVALDKKSLESTYINSFDQRIKLITNHFVFLSVAQFENTSSHFHHSSVHT